MLIGPMNLCAKAFRPLDPINDRSMANNGDERRHLSRAYKDLCIEFEQGSEKWCDVLFSSVGILMHASAHPAFVAVRCKAGLVSQMIVTCLTASFQVPIQLHACTFKVIDCGEQCTSDLATKRLRKGVSKRNIATLERELHLQPASHLALLETTCIRLGNLFIYRNPAESSRRYHTLGAPAKS